MTDAIDSWLTPLTVVGIGAVIFAAVSQVREALLSLHFDNLDPD